MSGRPVKVRARAVDQLHRAIKAIQQGNLIALQNLLSQSKSTLNHFKDRLAAPRVPKDHSPLVAAIINGDLKVFKYLLTEFTVNLEQETSAIIEGGYPVEGATPLWTASTLGRIEFVELLVRKGADIEHTTDSKSSPLRGAAFDGHCNVCKFLIDKGANIDKPNQVGQSPLTIAAAMQKKECVELLIKRGADVNHKGHNGDTPLHVSVESGAVEIARLLVTAGAKNNPNDVGFTPAILACCYGHKAVMLYLHSTFTLSQKELYDCYCLLAAKEVLGNNFLQAETYMRKSLEIREKDPTLFSLPRPDPIYDDLEEPRTEAELRHILTDETRMFFISSIYCERVLGQVHPTTAFYIRISGDMVLAEDRYKKCIDLWHRSLEFDAAARMAYELQITEDLLFAVRGFSIMVDEGYLPPVEPHFKWGLKEYRMAHESKISEVAVISCLFRMIAVWIKVADNIAAPLEATEEWDKIASSVDDLMKAMEGNTCPVLIACLQNLPDHSSGAGKDIIKISIPLHKAAALFLERGCPIDCEDQDGNFPLHLAVKLSDNAAAKCVKMLLEYGAHYDAVNFSRETAFDVAKSLEKPTVGVVDVLSKASCSHVTLQCLASQAVVKYGIQYAKVLPPRVVDFVSWHEGDMWSEGQHVPRAKGSGAVGKGSVVANSCLVTGKTNGFVLTHPPVLNSNCPQEKSNN